MTLARALVTLVVIASVARARVVIVDPLPAEDVYLRNGLHVVLAPDPSASSVAVHQRYRSGSAIERPGQAGYTYLLAKLMTAGSVHVKDFEARIDAVGGWTNATATSDHIAITDFVPANALELALWLEAERMAGLADGIREDTLAAVRDAVKAEWRAAYVDDPYALVTRELERALWTGQHAGYGSPVLGDGYAAHVASAGVMRGFARERLTPNNAILVVAGRFDRAAGRKLVERYFGWIPKRETVAGRYTGGYAPRESAVTVTVKDPIAKVVVAFRCPTFDRNLDVALQLLTTSSSARLQRLVDAKLATEITGERVYQSAGEIRFTATPAPGVDPTKLADAMRAEIAKLRTEPPTDDELARANEIRGAELYAAFENLATRAELLASWRMYPGGDAFSGIVAPGRATRAQLEREVATWLADTASVTVIGRPEGP